MAVRPDQDVAIVDLAAALAKVTDQFLATFQLGPRRLVVIKIAYQTNAERDIVQIIAMDVAAIDLAPPAISHFNLPVAGRCAVANDEMIGQTVPHPAHMSMVIIKNAGIALPRPAIVNDDELPAAALDRRAPNLVDHRSR